jgi:hypothetical protein
LYSKCKLYPEKIFSMLSNKFFDLQQSKWEEIQKPSIVNNQTILEIEDSELFVDPKFFNVNFEVNVIQPKENATSQQDQDKTKDSTESKNCNNINHFIVSKHLIVFIPGWNGTSLDFKILKNYMEIYLPNCEFHPCISVDEQANYSIEELADKISEEVNQLCSQGVYSKIR